MRMLSRAASLFALLVVAACSDRVVAPVEIRPDVSAIDGQPLNAKRVAELRAQAGGCAFTMPAATAGDFHFMYVRPNKLPFSLPTITKNPLTGRGDGRNAHFSLKGTAEPIGVDCWVPSSMTSEEVVALAANSEKAGLWNTVYRRLKKAPILKAAQIAEGVSREMQQVRWEMLGGPSAASGPAATKNGTGACVIVIITVERKAKAPRATRSGGPYACYADCSQIGYEEEGDPPAPIYLCIITIDDLSGPAGPVEVTIGDGGGVNCYCVDIIMDSWGPAETGSCGYEGCFDDISSGGFDGGSGGGGGYYTPNWSKMTVNTNEVLEGEYVIFTATTGTRTSVTWQWTPDDDPENPQTPSCGNIGANGCVFYPGTSGTMGVSGPGGSSDDKHVTVHPNSRPDGISESDWLGLTSGEKRLCAFNPMECASVMGARDVALPWSTSFTGDAYNNVYDAMRHALWSALITRYMGAEHAKIWTDAHESETPSDKLGEKCMDTQNNAIGRQLAVDHPTWGPIEFKAYLFDNRNSLVFPTSGDPVDTCHGVWP